MYTLKSVLDALSKHEQRATYGAVAAVVGKTPRSLMTGLKRSWKHSWVVNQETGLPGGYPDLMVHPNIGKNPVVLSSPEQLVTWLQSMK